jgi:hypothetical protein
MQSENEIFAQLIEAMKKAEECARLLGLRRQSESWMKLAGVIGEVRDKIVEVAKRRVQ